MGTSAVIEEFSLIVYGRTGEENVVCLPGDVLVGRLNVKLLQHIALTCKFPLLPESGQILKHYTLFVVFIVAV